MEARGVKITRHGAELIGLCPFHDDREPSLVVNPQKNLWHCLGADEGTVFLTNLGEPYTRVQLTTLVRGYIRKSKIGKMDGCHLFRHTVATLMLGNGANIRVIQEMLGHAKIATTELYTRVSINLLKQVYPATHPAANLKRAARADHAELASFLAADLAAEEDEEV